MFDRQLNPQQLEAVRHGDGPVLVIAGAGTGKTMTLAARVAHLIAAGTPPERILLLTFSRRAAAEMLSRTRSMLEGARTSRVVGGTFHAVAAQVLRQHGRSIGVHPDFSVLDQSDTADLLNLVRGARRDIYERKRFPRKETLADIYSRTVNASRPLKEILATAFPWCVDDRPAIAELFTEYTNRKRAANLLDYDDLLLCWNALMADQRGARLAARFDHVLVDEYQDVNAAQAQIVERLHHHIKNVFVVGDDAQAIYSFRSATVDHILEFPRRFPDARVILLERNYRSTAPLLAASNAVIAQARQRFAKTLVSAREGGGRPQLITCRDENVQSDAVCLSVLRLREQGVPLVRQAVLFRASHHSDLLEVELSRRNIPFVKYGGLKFLEAAHVKDVVAMLRVLDNPRDTVSWFRILQLLEGVGPAHATKLIVALTAEEDASSPSPLRRLIDDGLRAPEPARESLDSLRELMRDLTASDSMPLPSQIERVRRFCEPVFQRLYANADSRLRDIEQLEVLASSASSRTAFLTDLALDPPSSTSDLAGPPLLDEDYLILSTIHSAKGGEWDAVRVIHAADGNIPSDMATGDPETIAEERRLFYVALTRARDVLEVYFPLRYFRRPRGSGDAHSYAQLTRFLPEPVQGMFDRTALPEHEDLEDEERGADAVGVNPVDALLRSLWEHEAAS